MAKNDFPKPTPAESFPLGHAKENKDASAYTGFKYPAGGGNDINIYKQPEVIGNPDISAKRNPNALKGVEVAPATPAMTVSVGDRAKENINPYGVGEMRGYGAAIKGRKISGKQG